MKLPINLYSDCRGLLLSADSISKKIKVIDHQLIKEKLTLLIQTCQADLLIITDFIYELELCENEGDLKLLLETYGNNSDSEDG